MDKSISNLIESGDKILQELMIFKIYHNLKLDNLNNECDNLSLLKELLSNKFEDLKEEICDSNLYRLESLIDFISTNEQKYYDLFLFKTNDSQDFNNEYLEKFINMKKLDVKSKEYKDLLKRLKFLLMFTSIDDKDKLNDAIFIYVRKYNNSIKISYT